MKISFYGFVIEIFESLNFDLFTSVIINKITSGVIILDQFIIKPLKVIYFEKLLRQSNTDFEINMQACIYV